MSSASWGKLYESTFSGSMFGAGPVVFAVWSYAIAHMRPPLGVVELNPAVIGAALGCDADMVQKAIDVLCAPDTKSRSKAEEGRRLVQRGAFEFQAVNFQIYRAGRQPDERREQNREAQARFRLSSNVNQSNPSNKPRSATVSQDPVIPFNPRNKPKQKQIKEKTNTSFSSESQSNPTTASSADAWACPDGVEPSAWSDWLKVRKRKKAENSERAYAAVMAKIETIRKAGLNPTTFVDKSATNGWSDLYPPEGNGKAPTSFASPQSSFGAFDTTGMLDQNGLPKGS